MDAYGFDEMGAIFCENCQSVAQDIHHIIPRSRIFGKERDDPNNLIALCRNCHDKAHYRAEPYLYGDDLQKIHNRLAKK